MPSLPSGGAVLVDQLVAAGADTVYCVPGESYLAALEHLWHRQADIRTVTCRQEGGACLMANAHAKITGSLGVCFVTRGPGATNASIGVHTAAQDGVPLLLLVGQVPQTQRDRSSFQEVDYGTFFGSMAKAVIEVRHADRMAEQVSRAIQTARAGRPGPVAVALPEDVLRQATSVAAIRLAPTPRETASDADVADIADALSTAEAPLLIVGGAVWSQQAADAVQQFAERHGLPVAAAFRRQDYIDNTSGSYIGVLGNRVPETLGDAVREADLIVALGSRLGRVSSGNYGLITPPAPQQRIIQVTSDRSECGRVLQPDLVVVANPADVLAALLAAPDLSVDHRERTARLHEAYLRDLTFSVALNGEVDLTQVMADLRVGLPDDAILANGAGNFTYWANGFYQFKRHRTQLGTTAGAMGYAIPSAVAAKIAQPRRVVVAFSGDGDFLMNGQELATAVQHGCGGLVVIVVNNGSYGTIRAHQERSYPGHPIATQLLNPNFAALADAFGCAGVRIERTAHFAPALEAAVGRSVPTLIELMVDTEIVSPTQRLSDLRPLVAAAR